MERSDELFDDLREELFDLPVDDDGALPPPPPDDDGPGRRPRRRGPGPGDAVFFSPWATFAVIALIMALTTLQITIISFGARGGYLAVGLLSGTFGLLFLGPFIAGSLWFGARRRGH